jgi:hypothetical protein
MECIPSLASNNNNLGIDLENDSNLVDESTLKSILNPEIYFSPKKFSDLDIELIRYLIVNTGRDIETGRLIMPCLWNKKLEHLLPNNFHLANCVLKSILKKYKKDIKTYILSLILFLFSFNFNLLSFNSIPPNFNAFLFILGCANLA